MASLLANILKLSDEKTLLEISVKDLFADATDLIVSDEFANYFAPSLAMEYPSVAPVSWIMQRLIDSKGTGNWYNEYTTKTGYKASAKRPIQQWAEQLFWERIAQRMFEE